jgi:D-galactonate transporter
MSLQSIAQPVAAGAVRDDDVEHIYRKITRRLIPMLFICYMFNFVDRANIGFAQLQMKSSLGFSDAVYGLGAAMFFIGYILFEVPSNLLLRRIGARKTILRIMVLWGLASAATMFVVTPTQFYVARFLLGVFEAGFFPGIVLYLTFWYPQQRRARVMAIFMMAAVAAGIIIGPVSGWILKNMDGLNGWAGWQWMFLLEGLPSVVLGIVAFLKLADSPADAKWLSAGERRIVEDAVQPKQHETRAAPAHSVGRVFRDPKVWLLCFVVFTAYCGAYFFGFWVPTIIRDLGVTDLQMVGIYSVVPNFFGAAAMFAFGRHSDLRQERRWHFVVAILIGAVGLLALTLTSNSLVWTLVALTVGGAGIMSALPIFWAIATRYLSEDAAPAGIALITSIASLAGVTPALVGTIKTQTGSLTLALYLIVAVLLVGMVALWRNTRGMTQVDADARSGR